MQKITLISTISFVAMFAATSVVGSANLVHAADSASIDASVTINQSLTLDIPSSTIAMNLDPANHAFDEQDLVVSVGTNNPTGYQLTVSTVGDTNTLVNASDSTKTIPNLSSSSSAANFPANYWGYRISNGSTSSGNYGQFTSGSIISESDGPVNAITKALGFASKVDFTKPSGSYELDLSFTAVANPPAIDYMQDFTTQEAESMATGETKTLADSRDGQTYTVAKLADGNVWLLENLRLDISDPSVQANLTSTTTNATDTILGYLKNGGGSSPYPANGVITKTASGGSWTNNLANPYIATQYKDTTQAASGSAPAGKIGIYYNYCAASAGSYCYAAGAGSGNASYDICPKGWRMPTGGASGEYQALYTAYSSNVGNFMSALSTPLSGWFYSGSASGQGMGGLLWSSTINDTHGMYNLEVSASTVDPQTSNNRGFGFSVRCVLK